MRFWNDVRLASRVLVRTPTTTAIIIVTLALCIGANTAIFSIVDATLLRPLPYPEPSRLARIVRHYQGSGKEEDETGQDGAAWMALRDHVSSLEVAVYNDGAGGVNFSVGGTAQFVKQQRVGAGFFRMLGVQPMMGREFTAAEDVLGGPAVAILSYPMWRRISSAVGSTIMLRGEPFTVIGVMPEHFRTDAPADLWTPLRPSTRGEGAGVNYAIAARLKAGITWAQANAEIEALGAQLFQFTKLAPGFTVKLRLMGFQEGQTGNVRNPLLILWGAVGLVLLIGCANVASLLLARAASRGREIATRMALGGSRGAIVRQLLVEAGLLAFLGGAAGVAVGYLGIQGLRQMGIKSFPVVASAELDGRVLAVTLFLSILVSLLAGVFPAFEAVGVDIRNALTEAGGRGVAGARKRWSRQFLVAGEVALAVLLLIGAGLMVRTLLHFYQLRPGFDPAHVITASFSLQDARYATAQSVSQFYDRGLERLRRLPGVESAGVGLTLPYENALNSAFTRPDGPEAGTRFLLTNVVYVSPGYLETLRIPLLRGRSIREGDVATANPIGVVNEAFRAKYLSRQEPLASHLKFGSRTVEVVGIVGDVQQRAGWGNFGPLATVPSIYMPSTQVDDAMVKMVNTWFPPSWVVRVSGSPETAIRGIQETMTAIDPLLPIADFRTLNDVRAQTLSGERFEGSLLGALATLALLLAVVGIYGLMSQSVAERRRELGIRIALGASLPQAVRSATVPGIVVATAGVIIGCALALACGKLLEHLIWGVSATDPATYTAVVLGLLGVAVIASLTPALRITRINPAETLRDE